MKRGNFSAYATSHGKGGVGLHRLTSIIHAPDVLTDADVRAASAFGHTAPQRFAKAMTTKVPMLPTGVTAARDVPLYMATPERRVTENPVDVLDRLFEAVPGPENASPQGPYNLPDLKGEAQQRNPQNGGAPQKAYKTVYTNQQGHDIGSDDGVTWYDVKTGELIQ